MNELKNEEEQKSKLRSVAGYFSTK